MRLSSRDGVPHHCRGLKRVELVLSFSFVYMPDKQLSTAEDD